ncbi:hypothetical protein BUZ73_12010 [Staphylococcus saprophyticus]|uniref:DUF536 domain-containing protein n=1 Tax=Staphylococcus saprophyticus TaxID=29385 RepID=UPI000CD0A880|nr:DUF536 domain-containing protein [Staphylococcus saprophyticus]PNZ71308.1 hypothetical protein CD120_07055 [Staphylococcus saprophyticus]PTK01231.1 hypothetical protein BUZ73_12010 [Staphylococcus saprophyticus]TQR88756.1 DUF536 domain-containing protein [Staphylococcus saprophyticus]
MKSFKKASEELKITKQTLTAWIEDLNESHNIIWKNKTRYLDELLINKIKEYKNIEIENESKDNLKNESYTFNEKEELLEKLKEENNLLVKQLSIKDNQIKDLTRLLDQQQQLTISDKNEKEELKKELKIIVNQIDYMDEVNNTRNPGENEQNDKSNYQYREYQDSPSTKKGFWRKLFNI